MLEKSLIHTNAQEVYGIVDVLRVLDFNASVANTGSPSLAYGEFSALKSM